MRKNAEKMDLSSRNRLLRVPAGSHGFWAHDPLPDPSHDPHVDPRRVTIPLAFTTHNEGQDIVFEATTQLSDDAQAMDQRERLRAWVSERPPQYAVPLACPPENVRRSRRQIL